MTRAIKLNKRCFVLIMSFNKYYTNNNNDSNDKW